MARIRRVKTGDVGQQDEQVRIQADRDPGRQPVVVAEADRRRAGRLVALRAPKIRQFGDGDAVVFVEHRQRAELQQPHQRRAQTQRPIALGQILLRQQDLGGGHVELRERLCVQPDQVPLPHRRAGLPQPEGPRALLEPQHAHPHADRAARHQHHLAPRVAEPGQALDDLHDPAERQLHPVVGDDVGTDLDDDAVRIGEVLAGIGGGNHGGGHERQTLPYTPGMPGTILGMRAQSGWCAVLGGLVAVGCATPSPGAALRAGFDRQHVWRQLQGPVPPQDIGMGVGMTRQADAGMVVRPDALVMEVTLRTTDTDPKKALAAAQVLSADLWEQLQRATSGASTIKMCGTSINPINRVKQLDPSAIFEVKTEGTIEVTLAQDLDYWKRSELLITVAQTIRAFARAREGQPADQQHERQVTFGRSRVIVRDPEAFRAKLTERWVARARAFAAAAQGNEAPLSILDCAPPGEIVQKEQSLEEVGLYLAVSCRLGSTKAPAVVAPLAR